MSQTDPPSLLITDNGEDCSVVPDINSYTFYANSVSYYKTVDANPGMDWNTALDTCASAIYFRHLLWVNSKRRVDDVMDFLGI